MVAIVAVTSGCRVLWLVAAVAMPSLVVAAAAAPARTPASLRLNRSERNTDPRPSSLGQPDLVEQVGRLVGVAGQAVAGQLGKTGGHGAGR